MAKIIIIGIDGATFDILDPLVEMDVIPNLENIYLNGAKGKLKSVYPPITAPAWTSFATGKNPGKTGAFDFRNRRDEDTFDLESISSHTFRKAKPYWDLMSEKEYRVGVYNYPFLYPPYSINGFMTSGTGSGSEQEITYPKNLKLKLKETSDGDYEIQIPYAEKKYQNNLEKFMKDAFDILECNKSHIKYLLKKNLDIYTFVLNVSDFAQHYMWDKITNGKLEDLDNAHKTGFLKIWKKIDEIVGLIADSNPNANIFIVSDHGFGPNRYTFYINSWLEDNGFVVRKDDVKMKTWFKLQKKLGKLIEFIGKFFPSISRRLWREGEKRVKPFTDKFDMNKTKILSLPQSIDSGKLWVNHKVVKEEEIEDLLRDVIKKLRDFFYKKNMRVEFFRKEEIYEGEYLKYAPDLLFKVNDFECSVHYSFNEGKENFLVKKPDNPNRSGAHKTHGIFFAYGPDIRENDIHELSIMDITPTILHALNMQVPNDIDGKTVKKIFKADSNPGRREVKYKITNKERDKVSQSIIKLKTENKI